MDAEERQLSDRERTVLLLAAEGLTDKEIAKHLDLSQRTIGTYWERMRQKLGPFSRTQLVARFLRLEAELERSNESYRNLFSAWDEGVWILAPSGRTIYANQPAAHLLGRPLEELLHANAMVMLGVVVGSGAADFVQRALHEGASIECQLKLPDGNWRWLSLRGSPVSDRRGHRSAVVLILRDLTFQKRVRETLVSCRQCLELLAEHSSHPIARFDGDLVCVYANDAFAVRLGLDAGTLVGAKVGESPHFMPASEWEQGIREALSTGQSVRVTVQLGEPVVTHLFPEPAPDLQPVNVLSIIPS